MPQSTLTSIIPQILGRPVTKKREAGASPALQIEIDPGQKSLLNGAILSTPERADLFQDFIGFIALDKEFRIID
jgi:hypothetical protein